MFNWQSLCPWLHWLTILHKNLGFVLPRNLLDTFPASNAKVFRNFKKRLSSETCSLLPLSCCLVWKDLWLICGHPCLILQSIGLWCALPYCQLAPPCFPCAPPCGQLAPPCAPLVVNLQLRCDFCHPGTSQQPIQIHNLTWSVKWV